MPNARELQSRKYPDSRRRLANFGGWTGLVALLSILAASEPRTAPAQGWTAPDSASRKKNPVSATPKGLSAGRRLYLRDCASCHGAFGKGDGPKAKDLKVSAGDLSSPEAMNQQTDGALFWKITVGNHPMPGYEKTLSDEQRWQLVHYMRKLSSSDASPTTRTAATSRKASREH